MANLEITQTSITDTLQSVTVKQDGSFIIEKNGYPYHIPNNDEFMEEWQAITDWLLDNQDKVVFEKVYERTLEEVQDVFLSKLNSIVTRAASRGYMLSEQGFTVNASSSSIANIEALLSTQPEVVKFRLYDNTFTTLSYEALNNLLLELKAHLVERLNMKWQLQEQVATMTIEQLDAFDLYDYFGVPK